MSRRRLGEAGTGGEMKAEEVGFALADGERHEACASRRTQGADRGVSSSCGTKRRGAALGGVRSEELAGDLVRCVCGQPSVTPRATRAIIASKIHFPRATGAAFIGTRPTMSFNLNAALGFPSLR